MNVIVNGEPRRLEAGAGVADVLVLLGRSEATHGIAVAVNGNVVPRSAWSETQLSDEDRIEVLQAIGGG